MRLTARIVSALVMAAAAIAAFAANVFAATPCSGVYCEPKMPEQLKKWPTQAGCCLTTRNQSTIIIKGGMDYEN